MCHPSSQLTLKTLAIFPEREEKRKENWLFPTLSYLCLYNRSIFSVKKKSIISSKCNSPLPLCLSVCLSFYLSHCSIYKRKTLRCLRQILQSPCNLWGQGYPKPRSFKWWVYISIRNYTSVSKVKLHSLHILIKILIPLLFKNNEKMNLWDCRRD